MKLKLSAVLILVLTAIAIAQPTPVDLLRIPPGPAGADKAPSLVAAWAAQRGRAPGEAVEGPGVSLVADPAAAFASRSFTFEAWVRFGEEAAGRYQPEVIAEVQSQRWRWSFTTNEVGVLQFGWGPGGPQVPLESDMSYDIMRPGRWYHLAVVFNAQSPGGARAMIFLTEQGATRPFCIAIGRGGAVPPPEAGETARLAVGRGVGRTTAGLMRIGSAAFYSTACPIHDLAAEQAPLHVPVEIIGRLPEGVSIDDEFEMSSLGTYGQTADGTILFSTAPRWMRNYWYAFRVRGARGKTLVFQAADPEPMMISPWIAEEGLAAIAGPYGGDAWTKPNVFVHRRVNVPAGEPTHFSFAHTFASDDALVSGCPMITNSMADAWLDQIAVGKLGARLEVIGHTPDGKPLRVASIGNPNAPLVWLMAGQHSAVERFGYHLITEAFEQAAKDAELLTKTRWLILPVVNESYMVMPKPGDPNLNRVWRATDTHPTISAIRRYLERESARTGTLAAFDAHAGTVQRGNTLAGGGSVNGLFERFLTEAGFVPVTTRARPWAAQPPPAPADLTGWHPGAESATFGGFGSALPLARAAYTLELSTMSFRTPEGAGPASPQGMRRDGIAFYKALKQLIDAPMPPVATVAPSGADGGFAPARGARRGGP